MEAAGIEFLESGVRPKEASPPARVIGNGRCRSPDLQALNQRRDRRNQQAKDGVGPADEQDVAAQGVLLTARRLCRTEHAYRVVSPA
jgi:hypothetical protein